MAEIDVSQRSECQVEDTLGCNYKDRDGGCHHSVVMGEKGRCSKIIRLARSGEEKALAGTLAQINAILEEVS